MGSRETYDYTYIYENGKKTASPLKNKEYLIYFFYEENDGWRYVKRGPETELYIEISEKASRDEIKNAIDKAKLEEKVKKAIYEMLEQKKFFEKIKLK